MTIAERKELQAALAKHSRQHALAMCSPQGLVMLFPTMEKVFKKPEDKKE